MHSSEGGEDVSPSRPLSILLMLRATWVKTARSVQVGRFIDDSTNGGEPIDFWGIYKEPNAPFIYASDRNGGLYVLKLQGSGSAKRGGGSCK